MRLSVFGRNHRIVAVFLLLLVSGGTLLTGGAIANHPTNDAATGKLKVDVVNANNEEIDGATVTLTDYPNHLKVVADDDGLNEIKDVPYEPQDVSIKHPDYKTNTTTVSVSTTNSPVTETFVLERKTRNVTGTINSTGPVIGDEVGGVTIKVDHENDIDDRLIEHSDDLPEQVTTNDSGMYDIEVPTGDVELTAELDGFRSKSVSVSGNERDIELDPYLVDVTGEVKNTEGETISNADVSVPVPDPWPARTTTTDGSGEFRVTKVPGNAERTVSADARNFQPDSKQVEINGDTDPQPQTLTLQQNPEKFTLTVTDTYGNPLNNIDVAVAGVDQDQTETRPGGIYSEDLPFGTHEITLSHPDYREKTLDPIEIEQGEPKSVSVEIERKDTEPVALSVDDVTPGFWQSGDEVTVDFSFGEEVTDSVELTVEGPTNNPETIYPPTTFSTGFDADYEGQDTFTVPEGIQDGTYTVKLSALGQTTNRTVDVSNVYDTEGVSFSETEYYAPAGDFVEVSVSGGDTGSTYVMIGGDRDADGGNRENYFDILRVSGGGFIINTRLVGTDRPSEDVYIPVGGSVTSYAYDLGAEKEPNGTFEDISFEDENGNQIASTLAEFRQEIGQAPRGSPLQVGRYELEAGATGTVVSRDGIPDFRHPAAHSNLVLTQPQVGNVTVYTLPPGPADQADQFSEGGDGVDVGSLLSEATETDRITRGDRILIEVQASGMYGALFDKQASNHAAVGDGGGSIENIPHGMMKRLLDNHEGVRFELTASELADPNHPGVGLRYENVKSSDLYILPDDTADQWNNSEALGGDPVIGGFYVVIDTRGTDPFDGRPMDGDELTVDFAYESPPDSRYQYKDYSLVAGDQPDPFSPAVEPVEGVEHFPYFGPSDTTVSVNDSFVFEEPFINYDETTLDGELIVGAQSDGFIRGQTNLAPGSTATIQLTASNRPDPKLMTIEDIEIDEDRAFDVTADFSELNPGDRVEAEFYTKGRLVENQLIDKRGVRVVDNLDNPATFEIANLTDSVTVQRGQQLGGIETTIVNTGDIADRQLVEVTIDGRTVSNETIVLNSGEETTFSLSEQFIVLSPGEYTYTVSTEDDEQTGQLTVTGSENTEISSVESSDPTVNEQPEENDNEENPPGIFGMVGLQRRDVAVAAAVTGAMHVLGQWT